MCSAVLIGVTLAAAPSALAQSGSCTRDDFFAVVDTAGAELRKLNAKNKPQFQTRLNALRKKRGWNQETFLREATPLVRDPAIAAYDAKANALLARLTQMGQAGGETTKPDCAALAQLQAIMRELVAVQGDKWRYMFSRVDAELRK